MDKKILTKEEYMEGLIKPIVNFAMGTEEFIDSGEYKEEFINADGKKVTLIVMDNNWMSMRSEYFHELLPYRSRCYNLENENRQLKVELEKLRSRKKFLGIF